MSCITTQPEHQQQATASTRSCSTTRKLTPLARTLPLPGETVQPAFLIESFQPRPDIPYSCLQNPGLEGQKARVACGAFQYDRGNVRLGGLRLTCGGKQVQDGPL